MTDMPLRTYQKHQEYSMDRSFRQGFVKLFIKKDSDYESFLVGPAGFEPTTSSSRTTRATNCATARSIEILAEGERFELSIPCGIHAFQACALGHYATLPYKLAPEGYRRTGFLKRDNYSVTLLP